MDGTNRAFGKLRLQPEPAHPSMSPQNQPWLCQPSAAPSFPRSGSAPAFLGNAGLGPMSSPMGLSTPQSRPLPSTQASPQRGHFTTFNNHFAGMSSTHNGPSEASGQFPCIGVSCHQNCKSEEQCVQDPSSAVQNAWGRCATGTETPWLRLIPQMAAWQWNSHGVERLALPAMLF